MGPCHFLWLASAIYIAGSIWFAVKLVRSLKEENEVEEPSGCVGFIFFPAYLLVASLAFSSSCCRLHGMLWFEHGVIRIHPDRTQNDNYGLKLTGGRVWLPEAVVRWARETGRLK